MSIHVSSIVWQRSRLSGSDLNLLLAVADQANDEGEAWPGLDTLQVKARFKTRRGLLDCIDRVTASGELIKTRRTGAAGGSISNMYRVNLEALFGSEQLFYYSAAERRAAKAAAQSAEEAREQAAADAAADAEGESDPAEAGGCATAHGGGVPQHTGGGVPQHTGGVCRDTPESLLESSFKPSAETPARERQKDSPADSEKTGQQNAAAARNLEAREKPGGFTDSTNGTEGAKTAAKMVSSENVPPAAGAGSAREALEKCFPRSRRFLDTLLGEFPDRALWLELPPETILAALSAQRMEFGDDYVTPLRKALDSAAHALRKKSQPGKPAATDTATDRRAERRAARKEGTAT